MATNLTLINDALSLIGVLPEGQDASAEQGTDGLRALNDMLAEWSLNGTDIGYFPQTETTEDFPCDYRLTEVVKYNLAVRLCAFYSRPVPPDVAFIAGNTKSALIRRLIVSGMQPADPILPTAEAGGWGYNILTDN
jgi:hypothetical protein